MNIWMILLLAVLIWIVFGYAKLIICAINCTMDRYGDHETDRFLAALGTILFIPTVPMREIEEEFNNIASFDDDEV